MTENVNHPTHYNKHPSGIECIEIAQYFDFCLGCVFKYIWRYKEKGTPVEDIKKAIWYLRKYQELNIPCLINIGIEGFLFIAKKNKLIEAEESNTKKQIFKLICDVAHDLEPINFYTLFELLNSLIKEYKK